MTTEYPSKHDVTLSAGENPAVHPADSYKKTPPLTSETQMSKALPKTGSKAPQKAADAFRTISEVAKALDVQQHVLRFWETKFSYVRPLKRGGGRRYYRPEDFTLLKAIHHMLYTEGYTIKGVQKILREKGKKGLIHMAEDGNSNSLLDSAGAETHSAQPLSAQRPQSLLSPSEEAGQDPLLQDETPPFQNQTVFKKSGLTKEQKLMLQDVLDELKDIRKLIKFCEDP